MQTPTTSQAQAYIRNPFAQNPPLDTPSSYINKFLPLKSPIQKDHKLSAFSQIPHKDDPDLDKNDLDTYPKELRLFAKNLSF